MFRFLVIGIVLILFCFPSFAQEKQPSVCPTFSIEGPASGGPNPDGFVFSAKIKGTVPKESTYIWTVSRGSIIGGQGTPTMKVIAEYDGTNLIAELKIIGLDETCPNIASESLPTWCPIEAILLDEFSFPHSKVEKERFQNAVDEQKINPNSQLYIIEYFRKGTSSFDVRQKVSRVKEFLVKEMKLDETFFEIVTATADKPLTKIYRIPPGAAAPQP